MKKDPKSPLIRPMTRAPPMTLVGVVTSGAGLANFKPLSDQSIGFP